MHSVYISVCLVLLVATASADPKKRITIYITRPVRVINGSSSDTSQEGHGVPTAGQCSGEEGFCVASGDHCNGTIKLLHNSCNDHCICCVPDTQGLTDITTVIPAKVAPGLPDITTVIPAKVAPDECYSMDQVPCSEFPEGENFPHPTHCNTFFKCVGDRVEVKTCLSEKLYNHLTGWCETSMNIGDCMCPLKSAIIGAPLKSTVPEGCRPKKSCKKSDGTCRPNGCLPGEMPIPKACRPRTCTCCVPGCPEGFFMISGSRQCFKFFNDKRLPWEEARTKCASEGLHLGKPSDDVAATLRKNLTVTYGDSYTWLGAKGDGSFIRWERDGTMITSSDPLWVGGHPGSSVTSSHCLMLLVDNMNLRNDPGKPYGAWDCSWLCYPLCELA